MLGPGRASMYLAVPVRVAFLFHGCLRHLNAYVYQFWRAFADVLVPDFHFPVLYLAFATRRRRRRTRST